jgi:hypothetical protein
LKTTSESPTDDEEVVVSLLLRVESCKRGVDVVVSRARDDCFGYFSNDRRVHVQTKKSSRRNWRVVGKDDKQQNAYRSRRLRRVDDCRLIEADQRHLRRRRAVVRCFQASSRSDSISMIAQLRERRTHTHTHTHTHTVWESTSKQTNKQHLRVASGGVAADVDVDVDDFDVFAARVVPSDVVVVVVVVCCVFDDRCLFVLASVVVVVAVVLVVAETATALTAAVRLLSMIG